MRNRCSLAAMVVTLVFAMAVGAAVRTAAAGEGGPPNRADLLAELIPAYRALQSDLQFTTLRDQLIASGGDSEAMDRVLAYMPLSPLELMRIDMYLKRYEFVIPRPVLDAHERWVVLDPDRAREHYGDEYVDHILGRGGYQPPVEVEDLGLVAKEASVGANRNAAATFSTTPEDYQGEIQVAVNPADPDQVVAAANSMHDCGWGPIQAVFYSADGGDSWGYTCAPAEADFGMTCETLFMPFVFGSDPAVWWDDAGNVYLEYMLLCGDMILMSLGMMPGFAVVVSTSGDGGITWDGQGVVVDSWASGNLEDKNLYALDRHPTSPYYGRHYTCWDRGNNEKFAYSTNSGASWTEVDLPTAVTGTMDLGCEIAVEDNGLVHVVFDTLTCGADTCSNEQMFYTRSTNGGVSWSTPTEVRDFNLVSFSDGNMPGAQDSRGINPFGAIEVDNSGGVCDGTLYATFSDFTTGNVENTDIFVVRSTDGGATWGAPVRVNDDGEGGGIQFHPYMMVDQSNGNVVVAWHDARNDPSNHAIDYYLARSTDCGASFEANLKASQASPEFNNSGLSTSNANTADNTGANPNQYGEYMGLDVAGNVAYLAWSDTRHFFPGSTGESQKENLGFVKVVFEDVPVDPVIFADGFEAGDTGGWSATTP